MFVSLFLCWRVRSTFSTAFYQVAIVFVQSAAFDEHNTLIFVALAFCFFLFIFISSFLFSCRVVAWKIYRTTTSKGAVANKNAIPSTGGRPQPPSARGGFR